MEKLKRAIPAAIVTFAIFAAVGCTTEEIDQTLPPYASMSDAGRDPANTPKPVPVPEVVVNPEPDEPPGVLAKTGHAIAAVVLFPFRMIGDAVEWIF